MDQKDVALLRLRCRGDLLEYFVEQILVTVPREHALSALREITRDLAEPRQLSFPKLDPAMSDLTAAELEEEIAYLRRVFSAIAIKVLRPDSLLDPPG